MRRFWSINLKKIHRNNVYTLIVTRITTSINVLVTFFNYLVIPFTEKFEPLGSLVHKNSIQVTRLHRADLYSFLTPAHNLIRMDIS